MSTKRVINRSARRRYHANANNRHRISKISVKQQTTEIKSDLIQNFNNWCASLRIAATYEFDIDEQSNHRCKMIVPIFPNLQSIGNGATAKKEAKANAIIAFLAHMEKRKQVGLFVPYLFPNMFRNIQTEMRQANVATPDLNINANEYPLVDRMVPTHEAKKQDRIIKIIQRICDVRIVRFWQSANITFVYIIGPKSKEELIGPYVKALFQPDNEQMFNYGEKLFDIFSDEKFLDGVCQRLKVLCDNHLEKCKLFIRGSSVNVQCCYNEFVILRREFENEFHRNRKNSCSNKNLMSNAVELKNTMRQFESTRIDNEDKTVNEEINHDQLPDYSTYNDDVNASILRVLQDEEDVEEEKTNVDTTAKNEPIIIEVSDDSSESEDLEIIQTIKPTIENKTSPPLLPFEHINLIPPLMPRYQPVSESPNIPQFPVQPPVPQPRVLRHIVLDGQNIARNSNDYNRTFSWTRLSNAINYFKNRGHENIIAFLPLYLREFSNKQLSAQDMTRERHIRDSLINSRYIAFTPSRYNNGHRLTNYDDRFILQYAADNDGVVVSNDNFRDLQHEKCFQFIINNRILPFATINDTFMPATDPLGRNGPNLDEFLSKLSV